MSWIAYQLNPIDFGWDYLPTVEEAAGKIAAAEIGDVMNGFPGGSGSPIAKFIADFDRARRLAHEKGWEGDFRTGHEPRVLWLPTELEFQYAFVWKQDNNGATFVISPVQLSWLDDVA